ncbi:hypothetical protein GCM10011410_31650 [Hoyosella rhizosphaerae]|uniref:Antitoxin Xre/MbcA/ParS-like toxin-binding domain-containing protein n=1 Tax=Hoyosella rhizosphaerae TaxID=1755582 RepID=A0A916UK39_9ACTN|nr:hypothetical protein GCM10011410_31650 [Hoyosella rhizosphaerae]
MFAADRAQYLVDVFGTRGLAAVIGVSASQPSRWVRGEEVPGPQSLSLLIDLEHVLAKARLIWGGSAAVAWMEGSNSYLNGARPLEVVRTDGVGKVLTALDAEMWGGAA